MSAEIPRTSSRDAPLQSGGTIYPNEDGSAITSSHLATLRGLLFRTLFFLSPAGTKGETSRRWWLAGRSLAVQKQTGFRGFSEAPRREPVGETTSGGGGGGGHEEIASLPSNDVTTNANLITGPDIANRPDPRRSGVSSITACRLRNFQANRAAGETRERREIDVSRNKSLDFFLTAI